MSNSFAIGQPHKFEAGSFCDGYPHDESVSPTNRQFYTPSETLLTQQHLDWFESKTGFPMPQVFYKYFLSIPRLLTHHLPFEESYDLGDADGFLGGLAFTHADGTIFQYRPPNGKPAKYLWVNASTINDQSVREAIGYKPLFIPAITPRSGKKILVITEGVTKACCLSYIGFDSIHISGVTNWRSASAKNALSITANYDEVVLAFDMDWRTNPAVKTQLLKISEAYGAKVADWSKHRDAKGFDDLMLELGSDDIKTLRSFILEAKDMESGYYIPDPDRPYEQMIATVRNIYPKLYFDGNYWVNEGEIISFTAAKGLLLEELPRFYTHTKNGNKYLWGTRYNEPLDRLKIALTRESSDSSLYMQNGAFRNGKFTAMSYPDPRAVNWSYNPNLAPPEELISFLEKCHGNLNFRLWLRTLLDDSIQFGAILGVMGASGSGKSATLGVAKLMLRSLDCKNVPMTQLDKIERVAGLGQPRLIMQTDCQRFPQSMDLIYQLSCAEPIEVRPLYQTALEQRVIKARIAIGCVHLPYLGASNEGFDRRFKVIKCHAYSGMSQDVEHLYGLLEDPSYIERVANWALSADRAETEKFMDVSADNYDPNRVGVSITSSPIYDYLDKILIPVEPDCDVPLEDLYEGYIIHTQRNHRAPLSLTVFREFLQRLNIPLTPGISRRNADGSFFNTPDTIACKVDSRAIGIINSGSGSFKGISNRYFSCRELTDDDSNTQEYIISYDGGKEVVEGSNLYNPSIETINSLPARAIFKLSSPSDSQRIPPQVSRLINSQSSVIRIQ